MPTAPTIDPKTLQDDHIIRINQIIDLIEPWQDKFANSFSDLKTQKQRHQSKLARFAEDEQTLNIAIMGQVKAGKSSFLNALLFGGKPVLPEASTPKTANLTRISYAESPRLEVDFYGIDDWQRIRELASSDAEHQEAKVAKEQMAMIEQAGIDAEALIAEGKVVHDADDLSAIMDVLNDYAGNDGKYTGLVKMIRLYLPEADLKGYTIVDTPGMNDPVVSRTQRTKEEMANSDVVFFLSRASNFLDASDIDLLGKQLPEAGIKRLVLVASQYDSAIEQDGFDRDSLQATEQNLQTRLNERAKTDIGKLADDKEQAGMTGVAEILRSITTPYLASTYAYGFVNWDKADWNPNMLRAYDNLNEIADDEWETALTEQDWQRIAGFEPLETAYRQAKADKEAIIAEQKASLLPEAKANLQEWQKGFEELVQQRTAELQNNDIAEVEQKQKQFQSKIASISSTLEDVIATSINDAKARQRDISHDLKQNMSAHTDLKTRTGTETYEDSYEVSDSKWYNPFSWGRTRTVYVTKTKSYDYVSVADAVDQLNNYAHQCEGEIEHHFYQLVNANDIKAKLKKSLINSLDTKSQDFDPAYFRNLMNQSISQLDIPELSLDIGNVGEMISNSFSGEIRDDADKAKLKQQLNNALRDIFKTLNDEFVASVGVVISSLETLQNNLADNLTQTWQDEIEQLKADMQNKQAMVASYEDLLGKLEQV